MYKKIRLDNGLRIIMHRMPKMRSVALGIWIKVGGRYEDSQYKGISHFLEHLVFKGTKNYSCRKIKESIEGVGGSLNGFTAEEFTCYLVKLPARYLEFALNILSDMVINPLLPPQEIEKERAVILEEIKMHKDLPQSYVHDLLDELLWPKQPLGAPIIGTVDSVTRIGRKELSLFKRKFYTPENIVVSATGLLEYGKLTKAIVNNFSHQEKQNLNIFPSAKEGQISPQLKIFSKDTEQTHLALGFHSFRRDHPLKHAVALLHVVLGANMSSRLFHELREKRGLAYEIGTHLRRYQDTGAFIVHAGIDNHKVTEAIRLILEELQKIKDKLVSKSEFKRAKEFYLGQLMLSLEDTLDYMLWIGESTTSLDKAYSLEDIIKEVSRIKPEDIKETARCILKEKNLNVAFIGPLKDSHDKIFQQLKIN